MLQAEYIYKDKKGNPLYRQIRVEKDGNKSFYSEKLSKGEWVRGLKGVIRVLYNLPSIIEAVEKNQKIYFVEGEKDANTLIGNGLVATTISGRS